MRNQIGSRQGRELRKESLPGSPKSLASAPHTARGIERTKHLQGFPTKIRQVQPGIRVWQPSVQPAKTTTTTTTHVRERKVVKPPRRRRQAVPQEQERPHRPRPPTRQPNQHSGGQLKRRRSHDEAVRAEPVGDGSEHLRHQLQSGGANVHAAASEDVLLRPVSAGSQGWVGLSRGAVTQGGVQGAKHPRRRAANR